MVRLIPNVLCLDCGAIANHVSLRCAKCRASLPPEPTAADRAYVEWRMSNAQQHALRILADAPLDEFAVTIHRIRRDTLQRLCDAGLARWCPYSRPDPSWQITPAGRNALCR